LVRAVFDTNILIDFLRGRPEAKPELERFDDRAISVLSWIEVMVGTTPEGNVATRARGITIASQFRGTPPNCAEFQDMTYTNGNFGRGDR
jgi:predicted nucleic acid-binding protein